MVCSETRWITVTGFVWCLRQARAIRCSSRAGFQGRSQLTTTLAFCRFRPVLPESVLRKHAAIGIVLEQLDFRAAAPLRHRTGVQRISDLHALAEILDQLQHARPFGKNDHFDVPVVAAFLQDLLQLGKLGQVRSSGSRM